MKLIRLDLKNFRQHLDTSIVFADGLTGIIGPNGAGKSTILEGIAWALYGGPAVRGTNDTVRSKASDGGAKVNVALTFELGGSMYKASRTLDGSGRSGSAVLEVDGKPLRSGMSEVTASVAKLLGMDYQAFFTSFFTGQKQLEFMSQLEGRQRAVAISRMLGYERVTKARDQANEDRKGLHREIEGLERGLPDPEELKQRKSEAQANLADAKKCLADAEAAHKTAFEATERLKPVKEASDQKAKRHEEVSRRLEIDRSEVQRTASRLTELQTELAGLEEKRKELESLQVDLVRYQQAGEEYKKLAELQKHDGERQGLAGRILALEQEIKKLEPREKHLANAGEQQMRAGVALAEAEALLVNTDEKIRALREEKVAREHGLQAQMKQLESQKREVEAKRSQIADAGVDGKCPTCERPLAEELATVLANFDGQISGIAEQLVSLNEARVESEKDVAGIGELEASRQAIAAQIVELRTEKSRTDALVIERDGLREQLRSCSEQLRALRVEIEKLPEGFDQARYNELRAIGDELRPVREKAVGLKAALEREPGVRKEIAETSGTSDAKLGEIASAELVLAELAFVPEEHATLTREFDEAAAGLNLALVERERRRGEVNTAGAIVDQIEKEEASYKSRLEELKQKRSERLHLQTLAEALDKLRVDLNSRTRPELKLIASELLGMITDGRYNDLDIDEDYKATILDDMEKKPVISGGEEDIVNLALRLAISQMIADRAGQSFSLLVLDEVFGSLDDVRRDNVVALLQNLKNRFEQIILITHVESIHDSVDNCVWVAFDEKTKTSRLIDRSEDSEQSLAGIQI